MTKTGDRRRRRWLWPVVFVAAAGAVILIYVATRTSARRIDIRPRDETEVFVSTQTREGMQFRELAKGTRKPPASVA